MLKKGETYPLASWIDTGQYRAEWTGEFRKPKKGEWYLSGAIIQAYRAPNDLTLEYHIARVFKARQVTYWEEVK